MSDAWRILIKGCGGGNVVDLRAACVAFDLFIVAAVAIQVDEDVVDDDETEPMAAEPPLGATTAIRCHPRMVFLVNPIAAVIVVCVWLTSLFPCWFKFLS